MRDDCPVSQCRPAKSRKPFNQWPSWIEWRTRKRSEPGNENSRGHLDAEQPRDFLNRQRWRELAGGDLSLCLSQLRTHGCIGA